MKINGKVISAEILRDLKHDVRKLKRKKIIPHLAVILVGRDPASESYIRQKHKAARIIGAKLTLYHYPKTISYQRLAEFLRELSTAATVHGIIVQRPLPPTLSASVLTQRIALEKDIDGFRPKTSYLPPLGRAVFKILSEIYFKHLAHRSKPKLDFPKPLMSYLKNKQIVLLGRGETGGSPIAETLSRVRLNFFILTSKPENRSDYLKAADIIISAVGKHVVKASDLKPGVILIGVGVRSEAGKLTGDYQEADISPLASFYTPTPGGVGPVNVACLMQNLVEACKKQHH